MLRVCGVTYVNTSNYGTCFQAYALQKAIERITIGGVRCEHFYVPLWRCTDHPFKRRLFEFVKRPWKIVYKFYLERFKTFQKKIHYTECKNVSDLPLLNECFDAFVCGSDVIWNPEFNKKLGLYYLDFVRKYKFSYAASFGKTYMDDEFLQLAGKWISELSDISVREQSSVNLVKQYAGRTSQVVSDPVILLTRDDWDQFIGQAKKKEAYIFAYSTRFTTEYQQFLQQLQMKTGLKIVKVVWARQVSAKDIITQWMPLNPSPERWLQQLRDAEYVVTNSFHATVFATIFQKRFFTVVHGECDQGSNIRMYDFLHKIGMENRMVNRIPTEIDLSMPDYQLANEKIERLREKSIGFLRDNLEAAYQQKMGTSLTDDVK